MFYKAEAEHGVRFYVAHIVLNIGQLGAISKFFLLKRKLNPPNQALQKTMSLKSGRL